MTLAEIIAGAKPRPAGLAFAVPTGWMQGRTAYGGLSAALALEAARRVADDLPPLRTAQIAYVGPLAGEVTVTTELLRRGRTAAFVRADVSSEAGLGLVATFVFMADVPSSVDHVGLGAPAAFPDPPPAPKAVVKSDYFFQHFDYLEADAPDRRREDWVRWVRLREREGLDPVTALVAVADALPPAALGLTSAKGMISSMTWLTNVLSATPATQDGWWLLKSTADYARNGCSSQAMAVWSADGVPVMSGMQSVALFV